LAKAAQSCQGCPLYRHATQTVFGEGPAQARIIMVGEQPGDREDIEGRPFVGPAGRLLQEAMDEAGIPREEVYITNAVKHFKWEPRGKRRLHKKPDSRELAACRPWLEAEFEAIKPEMLVCLGATAAQALLGRQFRITQQRGKIIPSDWSDWTMATWHPSAVLRAPEKIARDRMRSELVADLQLAADELALHSVHR
jgi:DNA polymerase